MHINFVCINSHVCIQIDVYAFIKFYCNNIIVKIWDSKTSRSIFCLDTGFPVHSVCPHINHSLSYITKGKFVVIKRGCRCYIIKFWLLSSDSIKYLDLRNPQKCLVDHKVQMDARKGLIVSNTEIVIM